MNLDNLKTGNLYRLYAPVFCYNKRPFETNNFNSNEIKTISDNQIFILLEWEPYVEKLFVIKILLEDKIQFIIADKRLLIEIKEDKYDYI